MKAKLIAVTLAALPTMVLADVTLYGQLQAGIGRNTISNGPNTNGIQSNTSLFGVKGTEIINSGLKAIWQVESEVHVDGKNSADTFGTRDTFVGLDGGHMGKIRVGYLSNSLNDLYQVDQWQYSGNVNQTTGTGTSSLNNGVNGLVVLSNPGTRLKNAIRYDSDTFAGFSGNLGYGFGENNNAGSPGVERSSDIVSAGLNYRSGPYFISYGFQQEANPLQGQNYLANPTATPSAQTGSSVSRARIHYAELGYKDEKLFLGLGYQMATGYDWTDTLSGSSKGNEGGPNTPLSPAQAQLKTRQAAISAAYTVGAFTPKASYAKGWDQSIGGERIDNSGYRQYVVGVDYQLSKRTSTGLSYGRLTFDKYTNAAVQNKKTTLATTAMTISHRF